MKHRFWILLAALASCSDDGGGDGSATGGSVRLAGASAHAGGGTSSDGAGGPGGRIEIRSYATIRMDTGQAAAAPAAPSGGTELSSADLATDVVRPGVLRISGALTASGPGAVRSITSTDGDIVVSGTLRGGDSGASTQGILLRAPQGRVFVLGAVDASSSDGVPDGDAPGAVRVEAGEIYVGGTLRAEGEAGGATGADGGVVSLAAVRRIRVSGGISVAGGSGGRAGRGGQVLVGGASAVDLVGPIDLRGGDGAESGGAGGELLVGSSGSVGAVVLGAGPYAATGGRGRRSGGAGGELVFYSQADIAVAGTLDGSGGDSGVAPGAGGALTVLADVGGGSVQVSGTLLSRGGSATDAAVAADGGPGGTARLVAYSAAGETRLLGSAVLDLDGGSSTGTGTAGGGGTVFIETADGEVSISGRMRIRGGTAQGPGGTGGLGGRLEVVSDVNQNGIGDITIEPDGIIDASGGSGAIGGHARHDQTDTAENFPREISAVVLDSDTAAQSGLGGIILNLGLIIARGGAPDGWGGDVFYHGRGEPPWPSEPVSGLLDLAGQGSGRPGNFLGD